MNQVQIPETIAVEKQQSTSAGSMRLSNVSALRLLFAYSVALSHAFVLLDGDDYLLVRKILNSEAAVQGFFILSGGLVFASYERVGRVIPFYTRRLARLYPAYFVAVLLFAALGIADAVISGEHVATSNILKYLSANLTTANFLQPEIEGVFASNPLATINGALWSIKVEIMFYAMVPLFYALSQRFGLFTVLIGMALAGCIWWPGVQLAFEILGRDAPLSLYFQVPGQLHFFALGITLFAYAGNRLSGRSCLILIATVLISLGTLGNGEQLWRTSILIILIFGVTSLTNIPWLNSNTDLSYGIYLAHFPIIQLLISNGAGNWPLSIFLSVVSILACLYGLMSWRLIEQPALRVSERVLA